MNWLLWAVRLWADYSSFKKKESMMRDLRRTVAGVGLTLFGFMLGLCSLGFFLMSSFFFFMDQTKFSLAALWTALICSALTLSVLLLGSRFYRCSSKA